MTDDKIENSKLKDFQNQLSRLSDSDLIEIESFINNYLEKNWKIIEIPERLQIGLICIEKKLYKLSHKILSLTLPDEILTKFDLELGSKILFPVIESYLFGNQKDLAKIYAKKVLLFKSHELNSYEMIADGFRLIIKNIYDGKSNDPDGILKNLPIEDFLKIKEPFLKDLSKLVILFLELELEVNPNNLKAWTKLAHTYYPLKEFDLAEDALTKAISINPDYHFFYYMHAVLNLYKKDFQNAIVDFKNYSEKTNTIEGFQFGSFFALYIKDYNLAKELAKKGLEIDAENFGCIYSMGTAFLNLKDAKKAMSLLTPLLQKIDKNHHDYKGILKSIALSCYFLRKYFESIKKFQELMEIDKESEILCKKFIGNCYLELHMINEAEKWLVDASNYIEIDKEYYVAYLRLLEIQNKDDEVEKGIEILSQKYPDWDDFNFLKIILLIKKRKFLESEKILSDLLKKEPNDPKWIYQMGYLYYKFDEFKRAEDLVKSSIGQHSDDIEMWNLLGCIYQEQLNYKEAKIAFEHCLNIDDTYTPALNNLGRNFLKSKNYERAKEYYEKVNTINPFSVEALNGLGIIYGSQKNYDLSKGFFFKVFEIDPNYIPSLINIAGDYLKVGNFDEGIKYLKKLNQINDSMKDFMVGTFFLNMGKLFIENSMNTEKFKKRAEIITKQLEKMEELYDLDLDLPINPNLSSEYLSINLPDYLSYLQQSFGDPHNYVLEILIKSIIKVQSEIQMKVNRTEDNISDFIKSEFNNLIRLGMRCERNVRGGKSSSGKDSGEIDFCFYDQFNLPISYGEALILTYLKNKNGDWSKDAKGPPYLTEHHERLMNKYDLVGNPCNILIVYYMGNNFESFWKDYVEFYNNFHINPCPTEKFEEISGQFQTPSSIKMGSIKIGTKKLYHFVLKIEP